MYLNNLSAPLSMYYLFYIGKECQKSHWASHKTQCKAMGLQSLQVICHRLVGGDMQAMGIELCNAIRQGVLGSVPFPAQWTSKDMATLTKLLKELSKTDQGLRPYYLLALPVYAMVLQPGELASCQATLQEVVDTLDGLNQPLDYEDFIVISLSIARCELLFTMGRYADSLAVARGVKPQVIIDWYRSKLERRSNSESAIAIREPKFT